MKEKAIKIIQDELNKRGIHADKIILFGSRARGDFYDDSDWDFLVVIDKSLSFIEKREILTGIYRILAKLDGSCEIILKEKESFEKTRNFVGNVSYDADKEGVVLWTSLQGTGFKERKTT